MYQPNKDRYENMPYRNAGSSGLKLPEIQLGMWHNFSADSDMQNCRNMLFTAFDCGITLLTSQTITATPRRKMSLAK